MATRIKTQLAAAEASRILAALYPARDDDRVLEQQADDWASDYARRCVEDELERVKEACGRDAWDVAAQVRNAHNSCVATDILYAFFDAAKLNKVVPLTDRIDDIVKRLDVTEYAHDDGRWSEYVVFGDEDGGVDIDAISCWGKDGIYADGETEAIYGVGDSGYYINDTLLVSPKACAVLDELDDVIFRDLEDIERIIECHLERAFDLAYEAEHDFQLNELREENERLPENNAAVVRAELELGGEFRKTANGDYIFKSANRVVSLRVAPEFVNRVFQMSCDEADALVGVGAVA